MRDATEVRGDSVNALAARVVEFFLTSIRDERIDSPWPNVWLGPPELVGLGRRLRAVEEAFAERLKKKLSRVAKLARPEVPRGIGGARGLFVFFVDFGRAWLGRDAFVHGPRRMADDALAPSRSYSKVEEAYLVLGREPQESETVCDLGAAPGGWSYSAAKRGARVIAVDNGPLKGGALDHPTRGIGTGTMKRPPRRRYSSCCRRISSAKFHVSSRVKSGWAWRSLSGA
jgi:23S rRNA (cytidine2498-2'-O)-methyltransferase